MRKTPARGTNKQDTSQYLASERVSTQQISAIIPALPAFGYSPFTSRLASRQVLPALLACRLKVYIGSGALWLAVSQSEAKLLQNYAIGNSEGGPDTAVQTSLTLGPSQQGSLQVT